jgi:hypothetical protein
MAFRGFFALNGQEIVNSSRTMAHLGHVTPTSDLGILTDLIGNPFQLIEDPPGSGLYIPAGLLEDPAEDGLYLLPDDGSLVGVGGLYAVSGGCTPSGPSPGLIDIPASSEVVGRFYTAPNGARRFSKGLWLIGDNCWSAAPSCAGCRTYLDYDDSWTGLKAYLSDTVYRAELAPWYSIEIPESQEFVGVWALDVTGLETSEIERPMAETIGSGGLPGRARDKSRTVTFDALVVACTNAGLNYGMDWLTCLLRSTNSRDDSVLQYFAAHPEYSTADPALLVREARGVVLTRSPEVKDSMAGGSLRNQQATIYRITWEMGVSSPYVYFPAINVDVDWDSITTEPIEWVHSALCTKPASCDSMPVLFSSTCVPETIKVVNTPPPSCGGCMPVCALDSYVYRVPTFDYPTRCQETAASITITNTSPRELTVQAWWRPCNSNPLCDDIRFPLQISGLPAQASIVLDAISGRYWAVLDGRQHRAMGIVSTPNGAPWRPTVIDREQCWEFVVQAPGDTNFDVSISLADREP